MPAVEQKAEPKVKSDAKKEAPAPKKKTSTKKTTQKIKAKLVETLPPLPKVKPNETEIARAKTAKPLINHIDPTNIPPGTIITRDLATRVALEVAPPSRGFEVFEAQYNDRPAYQIRFKTENGPHDILVDAQNGKVLKN